MFLDENKDLIRLIISPITQHEISKEANVVAQTVNNAFNGNGNIEVSAATKEIIGDVIMEKLRVRQEQYLSLLKAYRKYKKVAHSC
jgi:hypothetical protein